MRLSLEKSVTNDGGPSDQSRGRQYLSRRQMASLDKPIRGQRSYLAEHHEYTETQGDPRMSFFEKKRVCPTS